MNALPDDEEISRKYPRQDASGIFEIDTETDIDTHFACWKFPIIPSPCARWADVDLFGTAFVKPTAPMKNWLPMPDTLPCRKKVRQYVDGRAYSGELRDEARKLYNAMSFKVLRDGWGFNTFITVTAKYLGLTSHAEFATLIPVMNKAVAGWLKARPKRSARFHMTEETNHSYIFVLERSGYTHGLHFHMLCTVPVDLRDEFRVFLADWWEQQSGLAAPKNAVDVKYSNSWGRPEHYANQALKFRYTIKTVPEDFWVFDHEGRKQYAVEFMKPWLPHGERPDILPIRTRQIYGISRDLDTKARQKWGEEVGWTFVSKFDQRRLDELYSGSEVQAWQARLINEPDWWELY
ncbi:hypothetical protein shn_03405 [Shinella sp. HZN7]|nr:hypothetical protein shn_03405 [Shinella sp. HZN7]